MGLRAVLSVVLLAASLIAAPPARAAAVRHASPTGSGVACTQSAPCSLKVAVENAAAGDTVQLGAEEYHLSEQLQVYAANLTIAGPAGTTAPGDFMAFLIFTEQSEGGVADGDSKLLFWANNVRLERLAISGRADGAGILVGGGGGSVTGAVYDRLYVNNTGDGTGLFGRSATLTNSVVKQTGPGAFGRAVLLAGAITGSTIYSSTGAAIWLPNSYLRTPHCAVTIRNSLVWGGGRNIQTDTSSGAPTACPTIGVDYDYSWIPNPGGGALGGGIAGPGIVTAGAHNLPNVPAVFDPTNPSDSYLSTYELAPTSPAVNAGCTASCSDHDYFGRPRPLGSANDIGAREQSVPPVASAMRVDSITTTGSQLATTLTPGGSPTTYTFQVRASGSPDWVSVSTGLQSANLFGTETITAAATALTPDTVYETRLVASNDRGSWTSELTSFRTATVPAPPAPTISVTDLKASVSKRTIRVKSSVSVSTSGTITQKATTGRNRVRCSRTITAVAAGRYALRCRLDARARAQVRRKQLRLTVLTSLASASGSVSTTSVLRVRRNR